MLKLLNRRLLTLHLAAAVLIASSAFHAIGPPVARGEPGNASKIDPALLALMASDRTSLLPVIVEMNAARAPFPKTPPPGLQLAQTALGLLESNGRTDGRRPGLDRRGSRLRESR